MDCAVAAMPLPRAASPRAINPIFLNAPFFMVLRIVVSTVSLIPSRGA
jgi:hypothetical protein